MRRVAIEGPEVELTARETVSLALVLHELATNAVKHGSLKEGVAARLHIFWRVEDGKLHFHWEAHLEDATIAPPDYAGFGTQMIRRAVERELSGELHMDWQPDGLKARFSVPLEKLAVGSVA
jgi:two-component sensor histidine kinase